MKAVSRRRARGFTLIELMVSIVIGLLAVLFATRIMTDGERSKDAALGGSESMQNGMLAMFQISADAEQAGFGLNDPIVLGCNTIFSDSEGYQLAPAPRGAATVRPLAGVVIEPGGEDSDRISVYAGSSLTGTGTVGLKNDYIGGTLLEIDRRAFGFDKDDVILVAPENPGGDCALAQISLDPDDGLELAIGGAGLRYNSGSLGRNFDGNATRIFNLGPARNLSFHTWSVENGYLRLRSTNLPGAAEASQPVADNIVALKAQYGFDNRNLDDFEPEKGMQVGLWSNEMVDADGDGVIGGAGDYQRIAALRIAVVARAKNPERPGTDGQCDATATAPTVFASAQPQGVEAVPVTVGLAVANDAVDWRCYRYRVFETIVPMRNAGWRPS
jgi:type IV pilus assembly protein PilW